jgi:hypothetical protein
VKASPLLLSLCAALSALCGCSTPCERVCSEYNACTVDQRAGDVDCTTFCDREQQFEESAAKAGADTCKTQFDAHISCWETNIENICKAEDTKCEPSATAWTDCMAKFCSQSHTEASDAGAPMDAGADAGPTEVEVYEQAKDHACVAQDMGPPVPALSGF